jgi:hypothetical protein
LARVTVRKYLDQDHRRAATGAAFGQRSIDYRHSVSELPRKPRRSGQALPDLLRDLGGHRATA